jgi:hypothetical protein
MDLQVIQRKIYEFRGYKVMLDFDLAEMYGVETRVLKQAVRRNMHRFPDDFAFELNAAEFQQIITNCDHPLKFSYVILPITPSSSSNPVS